MDTSNTTSISDTKDILYTGYCPTYFGWDCALYTKVIKAAQDAPQSVSINNLILLTLIGDLLHNQYIRDLNIRYLIIKDLQILFDGKNTINEPVNIEKFKTLDDFDITKIIKAIRTNTCTNSEILYCIQQILCK